MPSLFDPITIGAIEAPNRIFMAPLTRIRATGDHVPTEIMIEYYRQRASAGLIIAEAMGISRTGLGWPNAPGIWTAEQVEAWKPITDAVHAAGGRIMAQLWHMGRLARPDTTGQESISSSPVRAPYAVPEKNPYGTPRAATLDDIRQTIDDYASASRNAIAAGFDGVQVHGANGYLIDQFLRDGVNARGDEYGGPPENRTRLMREVMERVVAEVGADRTAIRLSPNGESQGTDDSDPEAVFLPAARILDGLGIAFLELRQLTPDSSFGSSAVPKLGAKIRKIFTGPLVLNQEYTFENAQADLDASLADAVSWGRKYIGNPDLVERFRTGAPLTEDNPRKWYSRGPEGYTDYPALGTTAP
ncbi:alkene reductase [Polymorphobacter glacialis]|uniref:Alkene reductase n=1 Tax=Sandarakinorhabdus glacialis TaxID=1614636 RepID=A0A917E687_9SPHN|nr:alkene reductase [Polymorphobacter glacialis]GGE07119.1 alkene reductase [Polymorphobacter glacialis]